jgi:hypothetical protein
MRLPFPSAWAKIVCAVPVHGLSGVTVGNLLGIASFRYDRAGIFFRGAS